MTIKDDLLKLKTVTATPTTATEAGVTSLTRDGTTGQVVVEIDKCPEGGIPIEVIASADTGTSNDKTHTVTIEGSDTLAFTTKSVCATFPSTTYAGTAAIRMVRRIATQYKYIRSVITLTGSNGTMSRFYEINVGVGLLDKES